MRRISTLLLLCVLFVPQTANAACGERGGPAFRGPNKKCVGWADLDRVCGNPPTTRCTYEGGGAGDTGKEKGSAFMAEMLPSFGLKPLMPPANFHIRKTKAEGIACTSQLSIARIAEACTTRVDDPECKTNAESAITSGQCAKLPAGTEVAIEAGSHSFDWLRFRVKDRAEALWSKRSLVLD
jgi:hypothetical protein